MYFPRLEQNGEQKLRDFWYNLGSCGKKWPLKRCRCSWYKTDGVTYVMSSSWRREAQGEETARNVDNWKKTFGTESSSVSRELSGMLWHSMSLSSVIIFRIMVVTVIVYWRALVP